MAKTINIQKLLKTKRYFQGFNSTPGLVYLATSSGLQYMWQYLGYGYTSFVEYYEHDKGYYGYSWEDLHTIFGEFMKRVEKDKEYVGEILAKDAELRKKHLQLLKNLEAVDTAKLKVEEITQAYQKLQESYNELLGISHLADGFNITTEEIIRGRVRDVLREKKLESKFNKIFAELTAPVFSSFLGKAHNDLLKAVLGMLDAAALETKYFWIHNGYSSAKYLDKAYFQKEIEHEKSMSINRDAVLNFEKTFEENRKQKERLMQELGLDNGLVRLLKLSDIVGKLQDDRKEVITKTLTFMDRFLWEIGRRYSIKLENMRYLIPTEITKKNMEHVTDDALAERRKFCIIFTDKESFPRFEVFTGEQARELVAQIETKKDGDITKLQGNCASVGKVTGTVKICRGESELQKMKPGDIMVACMTQPEFVPAMKKAAAIITDEGGITCHAAIVAREFGIPCVISTKIATRVLKDGMKVEVDADNGMVTVLD